jgi:predicted phage-related endonuclease
LNPLTERDPDKLCDKHDPSSPSTRSPKTSQTAWEWPNLDSLQTGKKAQEARRRFIGGSDANIIFSGDADRIQQLWLEKRGEAQPCDLSDNLAVILGCWTEPSNRRWYEKLTGKRITAGGKEFVSAGCDWRRCTVDGLIEDSGAVWEAKHTSAFAKSDELLERYMPQLQHNMTVTGYGQATLSVLFGNHKFEIFEIAADWLYQIELLEAEQAFWDCVFSGKEPVAAEPPPPPRPIGTREVNLDGNNSWASAAFDWLKHKDAAKLHSTASAAIKDLVEDDVSRAFGHGIEAKRNKAGAISIREFAL